MVTPEKKKRGHYKKGECPYCGKVVGNLKNHIMMAHPNNIEAPAPMTKEVLTGEKKPADLQLSFTGDTIYYCQDCHAELRKGEVECWNCGKPLDWTNIE